MTSAEPPRPRSDATLALTLGALVAACFAPSLFFGFSKLDDAMMITANPHVSAGLSVEGVRWAFTSADAGFYMPVTWLSLMLDRSLFGPEPWGFRLDSILQHAITAALAFLIGRRFIASRAVAFAAVLAFALHPMRVESVVWLAERKDTASLLLGALALFTLPQPGTRAPLRFVAAQLLAALAMLAKPSMVVLPAAMVLLSMTPGTAPSSVLKRVLAPWPAWLAAIAVAVGNRQSAIAHGFFADYHTFSLGYRLEALPVELWEYAWRTLCPYPLSVYFRTHETPLWQAALAAVAGAIALALLVRSRQRWLQWGVAFFVLMLLPALNLFYMTQIRIASRYTYLPHLGLAWALGAAFCALGPVAKRRATAAAAALGLAWAVFFALQLYTWRDWRSVYEEGLRLEPDNSFLLGSYGRALLFEGETDASLDPLLHAIELDTNIEDTWLAAATALEKLHRPEDAARVLSRAQGPMAARPKVTLRLLDLCTRLGDLDSAQALMAAGAQLGALDADGERVRAKLNQQLDAKLGAATERAASVGCRQAAALRAH